jgi:hypothetical protein
MEFDHKRAAIKKFVPIKDGPDLLCQFWVKMIKLDVINYFCAIQSPQTWGPYQWFNKLKSHDSLLLLCLYDENPVGFAMLHSFHGRRAQGHWMALVSDARFAVQYAPWAIQRIFDICNLDCLYGLTPVIFDRALKFLLMIGGKQIGVLPNGSYIDSLGKSVDSIIFSFHRRPTTNENL